MAAHPMMHCCATHRSQQAAASSSGDACHPFPPLSMPRSVKARKVNVDTDEAEDEEEPVKVFKALGYTTAADMQRANDNARKRNWDG